MDFIIVTGMSGSGKSKAIDMLEDMGFFCVDNVPPQMLGKFTELNLMSKDSTRKMAVVIDARAGEEFGELSAEISKLGIQKFAYKLLFLDASDAVLLNRYKEKRRRHPLMGGDVFTIEQAVQQERVMLQAVRQQADYVIDTTHMSPSQLEDQIRSIFSREEGGDSMPVQCMSFGFKHGMPLEADLVFDVRCLPNPFYDENLRERTGLEQDVRDYVFQAPESHQLLAKLFDLVDFLYPLYVSEGKRRLVVAMGCTGGKHRSVAFAQAMADHLSSRKIPVIINHRDKDKANKK